jgi:NifB/MoaA-like Fe-S oxidoreductase
MQRLGRRRKKGQFTEEEARRINGTLATGLIFYPMLAKAVEEMNAKYGTRLRVAAVENQFFGAGVTVAGLLSGVDFLGARAKFGGDFLMIPPDCYRQHDLRFLDGMTVGELAGELALPIKRTWESVLGMPDERKHRELPVLSHDYGSVTSISA